MPFTAADRDALLRKINTAVRTPIPVGPNMVPDGKAWTNRDEVTVTTINTLRDLQVQLDALEAVDTDLQAQIDVLAAQVAALAVAAAPVPVVYPNIDSVGAGSYQEGLSLFLYFAGEQLFDPTDNAATYRTELRVVPTTKFRSGGGVYIPAVGAAWGDVTAAILAPSEVNAPIIMAVTVSTDATPGAPYVLLLRNVANDGSVQPSPWVAAPFSFTTGAG